MTSGQKKSIQHTHTHTHTNTHAHSHVHTPACTDTEPGAAEQTCTQSKRVEVGLTTAFVEPYCAERGVCTSNSDCGDRREECDGKMFAGAGFGESCSKGALSSEDCAVKQSPDGEACKGGQVWWRHVWCK